MTLLVALRLAFSFLAGFAALLTSLGAAFNGTSSRTVITADRARGLRAHPSQPIALDGGVDATVQVLVTSVSMSWCESVVVSNINFHAFRLSNLPEKQSLKDVVGRLCSAA